MQQLLAGTALGPYALREPIGSGGMGEVYRAYDARLDREVALKVLGAESAGSPAAVERMQKEARAIAAVSHPNIVAVYDCGCHEGTFFIAMELLEGETLREHAAGRAIAWKRAVAIALGIANALRCAHAKGIVHRDLKPANVFLTNDGVVKILDFGLARSAVHAAPGAATLTIPGTIVGTVGYMSPEQLRGEPADARSDIFSLGCLLYEMLAGRRAFGGGAGSEALVAVLRDDPPPLRPLRPDLPESLVRLVERCLAKEPGERFQTAADLIFALEDVVVTSDSGRSVRSVASSLVSAAAARPRRTWMAGAVLVAAGLGTALFLGGRDAPWTERVPEAKAPASAENVNPEAISKYQAGLAALEPRDPDGIQKAIELFEQAVAIQENFALAHLGLAYSYMLLGGTYESDRPKFAMEKARDEAEKALAADPSLAGAHATLANIAHEYEWNWEKAEREFRLAISLKKGQDDPIPHLWYGQALILRGRHEQGLRELRKAELSETTFLLARADLAQAAWIEGDYDAAVAKAREVIEIDKHFWLAHWLLGLALFSRGDLDQAAEALNLALEKGGTNSVRGSLAAVYASAGRRDKALEIVRGLERKRTEGSYVSPSGLAIAYAWLGDMDAAYREVERAIDERASLATNLATAPIAKPIRDDPRYPAVACQIDLPPLPGPCAGKRAAATR
ncbi:MAG TPA: protein kinase [Thermoanaerobaculia bacterium]